jgi:hypothetical protein
MHKEDIDSLKKLTIWYIAYAFVIALVIFY